MIWWTARGSTPLPDPELISELLWALVFPAAKWGAASRIMVNHTLRARRAVPGGAVTEAAKGTRFHVREPSARPTVGLSPRLPETSAVEEPSGRGCLLPV